MLRREEVFFMVQAGAALTICGMATLSATSAEVVSGDALIGLYGATVGYLFGFQSGHRQGTSARVGNASG